jgi:K+-sensing histidine kinase KdpD
VNEGGRDLDGARDAAEERVVKLVHDLRTPLTIVSGFADLLAQKGDDLPREQREEFVQRIRDAAADLRALLDAERAERLGD